MVRRLFGRTTATRWLIAAGVLLVLVVLSQLVNYQMQQPRWLGMHATRHEDELVISWVQPGSWAWDSGVRVGDVLRAVDNRAIEPADEPALVDSADSVVLEKADGTQLEVSSDMWPEYMVRDNTVIYTVTAALFVGLSCVVFVLAADLVAASLLLALSVAVASMFEATFAQPSGVAWSFTLVVLAVIVLGASTLLFFLAFPIGRLGSRWGRWTMRICIAINALLVMVTLWVETFDSSTYTLLKPVTFLVVTIELLAAIALVVIALVRWSPERRSARRALGIVAIGATAALAPLCVLSLAPYVLGGSYIVPAYTTIISIGLLPVSLGIAILSRQFLGIERLLRRGLVGLLLWLGLVVLYAAGLQALTNQLPDQMRAMGGTAYMAFAVTSFPLLQGRVRRTVERLLFRDVYDYRATMQRVGNEIVHMSGVDAIAESALSELGATLDLTWAGILLRASGAPTVQRFTWGAAPAELDDAGGYMTPLVAEGARVGVLIVGPKRHDVELLAEDEALIGSMAPVIATALDHALLVCRLEAQVIALESRERDLENLSARLMCVQEEERRRLAFELHDDPLQRAVLLKRKLADLERASADMAPWREAAEDIVVALRAICSGLRPPMLDDLGLPAAAEWLVGNQRGRSELEISLEVSTFDGEPFGRLEPELELALYRVAQEALNNTLKHANATRAGIWLTRDAAVIRLRVADDGQGLSASSNEASPTSLGLLGMRERLARWDAEVAVGDAIAGGVEVSTKVQIVAADGGSVRRADLAAAA
ncbi:MAG TPA: ATP-binding protein [Chloroflexota bacterium]|jgi:signal transduction histidine kinase